jgi:DNA-binding CsgD family transcriptional regulator
MEEYLIYHQNSHLKLQSVYERLKHNLGMEVLGYVKLYSSGQYYTLGSNILLLSEYIKEVKDEALFFKDFLDTKLINGSQYIFILWPEVPSTYSMEICFRHKCWHGLSIIKFHEDCIEIWTFGTDPLNSSIKENYYDESYRWKLLASADYLSKHVELFLDTIDHKYLPSYNTKIIIPKQILNKNNRLYDLQKNKLDFINSLYPKGMLIKSKNGIIKLTQSELPLLSMLAKGMSSKQISTILGSSSRTVESQREHLKNKTGYYVKSDLVKLYNDQIRFLVE